MNATPVAGVVPWVRAHLCPLALALGFLLLYTLTLSDGGDPGKNEDCRTLLYAARHFVPTYTTGYPLYMLLAVPGLRLPTPGSGSSTALYASALPVVAAVLFFYFCALAITRRRSIALAAAVLFGLTHGVWFVATNVYVYGVALMMQWAFYAAFLHYDAESTPRRWLLFVAAFAGSCTAHPLNLILALPLFAWSAVVAWRRALPGRYWMGSALILLVGASLYLYLPLTSPRAPYRGDLRTIGGLVHYLTGEGRHQYFLWHDARYSTKLMLEYTLRWTHPAWIALAAAGALILLRRRPRVGALLLLSQMILAVLIVVYYSSGHPQFYSFFLMGLVWLWAAVCAEAVWTAARNLRRQPLGACAAALWAVALAILWGAQVLDRGVLDYHVRRLRADARPSQAVGRAMGVMQQQFVRADLWCDKELFFWLQTRSSGEGFHDADGRTVGMDWNLHLVDPPDNALPATAPSLLFTRHRENLAAGLAVREFPYGAALPSFSRRESGCWQPVWLEFDSLERQTPLRVVGMRVDWLAADRLRVASLIHVAGYHKRPEHVSYRVAGEDGTELGRSQLPINHRGAWVEKLLDYDELVDVREIGLSRPLAEEELIQIMPDFQRPGMQRLPDAEVLLLLPPEPRLPS